MNTARVTQVESPARLRWLKVVLVLAGLTTVSAFPAMFLPADWMASMHARLGLGEFPAGPLVDYLTRSIAALYGFHGALLLFVSRDPIRYEPIVEFIAVVNITFGVIMIAVDLHAGMPTFWTVAEGPPIILLGMLVGTLNRRPRE
jgi:hypothetical protein